MKTKKIISVLLMPMILVMAFNCSDEDGTTISLKDVSTRITGFGSEITGAGASLAVTGNNMDKVVRLFVGDFVVPAKLFTNVTESGFTFNVPASVGLGDNKVLFVWPGSERGTSTIKVVPLQVLGDFHPHAGGAGEEITITGLNLDIVNSVKLGDVSGTITENTATVLKFTMPSGATTGK